MQNVVIEQCEKPTPLVTLTTILVTSTAKPLICTSRVTQSNAKGKRGKGECTNHIAIVIHFELVGNRNFGKITYTS